MKDEDLFDEKNNNYNELQFHRILILVKYYFFEPLLS